MVLRLTLRTGAAAGMSAPMSCTGASMMTGADAAATTTGSGVGSTSAGTASMTCGATGAVGVGSWVVASTSEASASVMPDLTTYCLVRQLRSTLPQSAMKRLT